ncbi:unnamed protein product, partial [Mesorhabditis spiculigera]
MRAVLLPLFLLLRTIYANDPNDEIEELAELPVIHTAFVQTGSELHYFSESSTHDALLFSGGKLRGSSKKWDAPDADSPLIFDPPMLDFGDQSIGIPAVRRVRVRSRQPEAVKFVSLMASTINFYTNFFDKEQLESPDDDAWLEVAFLARDEGRVAGQLLVHIPEGTIHYQLLGTGALNPYRLQTFTGTRLPLNGTIAKPITIHNPHEHTLKIMEVHSSGGDIHVELKPEWDEKLKKEARNLILRPYETKRIGDFVTFGGGEVNTTAFIRIVGELATPEPTQKEVYIAYPVEVTKKNGIFPHEEYLDFGLIPNGARSHPLNFTIYSTLNSAIDFEQLYIDRGDHNLAYMEYIQSPPIRVPPSKRCKNPVPTPLVKVWLDPSRVQMNTTKPAVKTALGRIIAISRGGNYNVTVPIMARVYQGEVNVFENDLCLHDSLRPPFMRGVRLINNLPFGVAIWNISLPDDLKAYMTVRLFNRITIIQPGETGSVFLLKYNRRAPVGYISNVTVHTNITDWTLPVKFFNGRVLVDLYTDNQKTLDFGLLERNDSRTIRFEVRNDNPASVWLRNLRVPKPDYMQLYEIGYRANNETELTRAKRKLKQGTDSLVEANKTSVFEITLRSPPDAHEGNSDDLIFKLETDYESRHFPIVYKVAPGNLLAIPSALDFGMMHPGKLAYRSLKIFNAFDMDMTVTKISSVDRDARVYFDAIDPNKPLELKSGRVAELGRVILHPGFNCPRIDCYLGVPLGSSDGQWFVHGLNLPKNLAQVDQYLYRRMRGNYEDLLKKQGRWLNTTIAIDTTLAKNVRVPVRAEMVWPRLLTRNSVHFPLTALGNFTIVNLTLQNPTSSPIVVQIIPLVIYPDAELLVDLFRDVLASPLTNQVEMNETLMFSLRDTELFTLKPDSPVPELREDLEKHLKMTVPRFTLSLLLKPHMKIRVRLGFLPSDYELRSTLLLIRNNLTVIEPVTVYGRGARIGMQVGGIDSRTRTPLLFEIRHDHLTDCSNPKRLLHQLTSTLTVRRPFMVQNTGEVPFTVVNMSISGVPCENRGFRILNCSPFRLAPNDTYEIHVAFTPDFLSHVNDADLQLYMHMNGSAWVYHIAATVPYDMMSKCHQALPRPPFENLMYYSCATVLVFTFVCVVACAYLEGDRAVTCAIKETFSNIRPVFDLNNIHFGGGPTSPREFHEDHLNTVIGVPSNITTMPSSVQAREDDGALAKAFYSSANAVIAIVHRLWKFTLFLRPADETQRTATPPKRRGPVQQRWREQRLKRKEADLQTKGVKKVQPVAPLPAQPPKPPQPKQTGKGNSSPKQATVSRKSRKEAEKTDPKYLLATNSTAGETNRSSSRKSDDSSRSTTSRVPPAAKHQKATAAVLPTRAGSSANIKQNEDNGYLEPPPPFVPREPSPNAVPSISPVPSQHSLLRTSSPSRFSEASDLPEWSDEQFEALGGNVDAEFSDLAAASEGLFDEPSMLDDHPGYLLPHGLGIKEKSPRKKTQDDKNRHESGSSTQGSAFSRSQTSASSSSSIPGGRLPAFLDDPPSHRIQELVYGDGLRNRLPTAVPATNLDLGSWPMPQQVPQFGGITQEEIESLLDSAEALVPQSSPAWPTVPSQQSLHTATFEPPSTSAYQMHSLRDDDLVPNVGELGTNLGYSWFGSNLWSNDSTVNPQLAWASFTPKQPEEEKKNE